MLSPDRRSGGAAKRVGTLPRRFLARVPVLTRDERSAWTRLKLRLGSAKGCFVLMRTAWRRAWLWGKRGAAIAASRGGLSPAQDCVKKWGLQAFQRLSVWRAIRCFFSYDLRRCILRVDDIAIIFDFILTSCKSRTNEVQKGEAASVDFSSAVRSHNQRELFIVFRNLQTRT